MPLANILTPRLPRATKLAAPASLGTLHENAARYSRRTHIVRPSAIYFSRALAIVLSVALLATVPMDVSAQTVHSKKKKSKKPDGRPVSHWLHAEYVGSGNYRGDSGR